MVTGTRAEYSHVRELARAAARVGSTEVGLFVTGAHLDERFGSDSAMEVDGLPVWQRVHCPTPTSPIDLAFSVGTTIAHFGDALAEVQPDWVMVVGDRFEAFAGAAAAYCSGVSVMHFGGGDTTEGALDEGFRHSISKFSKAHFVTSQIARRRVIQLGEHPASVHIVGNVAVDSLRAAPTMTKAELLDSLGLVGGDRIVMVAVHPETLGVSGGVDVLQAVELALSRFPADWAMICTASNADPGGLDFTQSLVRFAATRPNTAFVPSLGITRFANVLRLADVIVGNSSAALTEAPSFGLPSVDIGSRQKGRARGDSVITVPSDANAIERGIVQQVGRRGEIFENPYYFGSATTRFLEAVAPYLEAKAVANKQFIDQPVINEYPEGACT